MSKTGGLFLAFDLGAESGRAVLGTLENGRLVLHEVYRFANEPVELRGTVHWNLLSLYANVLEGMRRCVRQHGDSLDGIGIDTWAVDFALLSSDGSLLGNPVHYRDRRTHGTLELIRQKLSAQELYRLTGMPLHLIQTLCQLLAMQRQKSPILGSAHRLLMMPDVLGYFLTGEMRGERTVASSSQLYDPNTNDWCDEVFRIFGLPRQIMPTLVDPGTILGELSESVRRASGLKRAPVIAPCTHDTASAVAAVPAEGDDWAFISSGTWSVLGTLTDKPNTSDRALAANACNELSIGTGFLCFNLVGMWVLQQARAAWQRGGESHAYAELVDMASEVDDPVPLINPNDLSFLAPGDMVQAIRSYCERTGQPAPRNVAETTRCILESLALSFRHALDQLADLTGRQFRTLHVVGGGSLNSLLVQLTANATRIRVVAGPAEATAAGNVLVQALACGCLSSPKDIRSVLRRSCDLKEYHPVDDNAWNARYDDYRKLLGR